MFGLSMGEILLLAAIALIVIGPKQLPEFASQMGRFLNEIKRSAGQFTEEIKQQAKFEVDKKVETKVEPKVEHETEPISNVEPQEDLTAKKESDV